MKTTVTVCDSDTTINGQSIDGTCWKGEPGNEPLLGPYGSLRVPDAALLSPIATREEMIDQPSYYRIRKRLSGRAKLRFSLSPPDVSVFPVFCFVSGGRPLLYRRWL